MSCFEAKLAMKFWLISGYFWEVEFWLNLANPSAFSGYGDFFHLAALYRPRGCFRQKKSLWAEIWP